MDFKVFLSGVKNFSLDAHKSVMLWILSFVIEVKNFALGAK